MLITTLLFELWQVVIGENPAKPVNCLRYEESLWENETARYIIIAGALLLLLLILLIGLCVACRRNEPKEDEEDLKEDNTSAVYDVRDRHHDDGSSYYMYHFGLDKPGFDTVNKAQLAPVAKAYYTLYNNTHSKGMAYTAPFTGPDWHAQWRPSPRVVQGNICWYKYPLKRKRREVDVQR